MAVKIKYFVHGTTTDNADKLCSGWKEANRNDWRKNGEWQPGWDYEI